MKLIHLVLKRGWGRVWSGWGHSVLPACSRIDYTCEYDRLSLCVYAKNVTIQTSILFPALTQGLILEWEAEKALIWMSSMAAESHWWHLFHKKVKSWDSTTRFRIWQFQTPAWKQYLQMHLLAERFVFFFAGDNRDFLKEGVKAYLIAPISPTFFRSSNL
jgi:hypothetical protein